MEANGQGKADRTGDPPARSETGSLEVQLLVAHVTGKSRSWVLAHPEAALTPAQLDRLAQALAELDGGKPLPYILGEWEFYGLTFQVQPEVLIPRPETERLVEEALAWCRERQRSRRTPIRAVDLGTGSGCIAVSLAVHAPHTRWVASDLSRAALQVARQNAGRHGALERMDFIQADLLAPFNRGAFDLICANLPYIPSAELRLLKVYGREPTLALDGGADGLSLVRRLVRQAPQRLAPDGLLLAEIEASQGDAAVEAAAQIFDRAQISLRQDLAGCDRLLVIHQAG